MNKVAPILFLALSLGACAKPDMIPNTTVVDTPLNRKVLGIVEKYRIAMEKRDVATVLSLVHPSYQDQAGTPEGSDDLDYEGIKELLASRFRKASKIRLAVEYQEVHVRGNEAQVDAYVDATFVYTIKDANPRWRRLTDFNRFRLIKDGSTWRFVSGL